MVQWGSARRLTFFLSLVLGHSAHPGNMTPKVESKMLESPVFGVGIMSRKPPLTDSDFRTKGPLKKKKAERQTN
jgi:hypothetical protein